MEEQANRCAALRQNIMSCIFHYMTDLKCYCFLLMTDRLMSHSVTTVWLCGTSIPITDNEQ